MKVEKFKVLLYLKKSGLDKSGKAPIMGRITVNRTMAQFSSKLSCTPELWNPRESRLNGKSKEAVEINAKIDKLLLAINSAFDSLLERKIDFDAKAVKEAFQGSVETQMTLLRRLDIHIEDMQSRIGVDVPSHLCQPISILADILVSLSKSVSRLKIWLSGNLMSIYHMSFRSMY